MAGSRRAADPIFEHRKRFYVRGEDPTKWLMVVVSYEQEPAGRIVVTIPEMPVETSAEDLAPALAAA